MKTLYANLRLLFCGILFLCSFKRVSGQAAEALNFDGTNDNITFPFASSPMNIGNNFTIEMWLKPASSGYQLLVYPGYGCITCPGYALSIGDELTCFSAGGNVGKLVWTGGCAKIVSDNTLPLNAWSHVAVTYNGSVMKMYINGLVQQSVVQCTMNLATSGYRDFGADDGGCGLRYPYNGSVDDFRIWNIERTEYQIQSYMKCEIPTTASNLTANYHFNQGTANSNNSTVNYLTDVSSSAVNGSLANFSLNGLSSNWIYPGAITAGYSVVANPTVEINVQGNSISIPDGNSSTNTSNYTDFGGAASRTFVVQNTVTGGTLNIGPYISGPDAGSFSITTLPASFINGIGSASFVVSFIPTTGGVKNATINLINNDSDEPVYDFVVSATSPTASALNFDGVDDYVETGSNITELGYNDFTIEAWIKTTSDDMGILTCQDNNGFWSFGEKCFYIENGGDLHFVGHSCDYIHSTYTVNDGNWHHVAVVWDQISGSYGQGQIYVDGIDRTSSCTYSANYANTGTFKIGQGNYNEAGFNFNGNLDEVRVWNVARSQCDLQTYMNCEIPSNTSGLLANYHFNQGAPILSNPTETVLIDATSNSFNGSLNNFALTGTTSNWVSPSNITNGYTVAALPTASIAVSGNGNSISNNASTTSTLNWTDFGFSTSATRTFVIQNSNTGTLNIGTVTLSGTNASDFSISVLPSSSLTASATTSFVVTFSPSTGGAKTASISIYSNDCSKPIFSYAIGGSAPVASALNFDGVNDYVNIAHTSSLNAFPLTVETWVKTSYTGFTAAGLVGKYVSNSYNGWLVYLSNGTLSAYYFNNISNYISFPINAATSITDNNWHHVAFVVDATGGRLYVDGILSSPNQPWSGTPAPPSTTQNVLLGSYDTYLPGSLDEVRIWNTARSQCEIQTYMNCEIPASSPGLLANYHFNQGSAGLNNSGVNTLSDAAGTNTGGLNGFNLTGTTSNWIAPSSIANNYSLSTAPTASISLTGNGNTILNNSTSPSTLNLTDFGSAVTRTFVIQNSNTGTLNISVPYIIGSNSSEFSVTALPSTTLAASATTSFVIAFTPTAGGLRNATVNIYNNDCSIPIFNFAIQGHAPFAEALSLDGSDDHIQSSILTTATTSITMQAKVYWRGSTSQGQMIMYNGNSGVRGYGIYVNSGTGIVSTLFGGVLFMPFNYTLSPSVWTSLSLVIKNGSVECYVNGLLTNISTASPNTPNASSGDLFTIGANNLGIENFNGQVDEVRFWDKALSQCEIQTYMNCEIPGAMSNLLANYHFNEGSPGLANPGITTVTDASGNGNDLTLSNSALTGTLENWVSPGAVTSGYTVTTPPLSTLSITGNGNSIGSGTASPLSSDFRDFGLSTTRTFSVYNSGSGTLTIGSVYLTGPNASQFSISTAPPSSISSGTNALTVSFTPTMGGVNTATVNITSNDCANPTYSFVISAYPAPASALNCDGTNDYVSMAYNSSLSLNSGSFTIEYWAKPSLVDGNFHWVVSKSNTNTNLDYLIGLDATNKWRFTARNLAIDVLGTSVPVVGTYYHVAGVFNGTTALLYVNGVLEASSSSVGSSISNSSNLLIGARDAASPNQFFAGDIDEVRIWNVARTQCEIKTYMNAEIPSTVSGLVANYHFNEGSSGLNNASVSTATDAAGTNDGTLYNFSLAGTTSNWVVPGSVANGYTISSPPTESISVSGNSNPINYNSTTVSPSNLTDFGTATTRTFVIQNSNTGTLSIAAISLTGINASEFSITVLPSGTLAASATTSFVVAFTPTASGLRDATVSINNSDCSKGMFNFAIEAQAPPAAALRFDGTDDYIDLLSNNLPTGNSDLTTEFWVKINSAQTGHRWISSLGSAASGSLMTIGFDGSNGNKIRVHHFGPDLMATTASITPNVWTHVAVNYRANTYSSDIFINGNYIETLSFGVPLGIPANPAWQVGSFASTSGYCVNMDLDELRMWNRALCAPEIQNNMNCEITTTAGGLVANYHFNEGAAVIDNSAVTTLTDASGSVNTGTLQNFALTGTVSNWCNPGAVTSGSSCSLYLAPEINLMGNGLSILDGDYTPSSSDNTDFLSLCANTVAVRVFSVQNLGFSALSVSSISMSGVSAGSFSVGTLSPASPISAGSSATFAVTFTPTTSGVISATLNINSNDCDEALYDIVLTGTANVLPTVTAGTSNSVICNTATTSLIGSGANTYTWTGPIAASNGIPFSPSVTASYSLAGTSTLSGCTSTNFAVQTITVNTLPNITLTAVSNTICAGFSTTLNVAGADTYTWNPGSLSGSSINPSPALTTTYTANGTSTLTGCTSTNLAVQVITVNTIPTVTASATSLTVCAGQQATLIGAGANTYTWNPGGIIGNTVNTVPATNTSYTLTGVSAAGCTNTNLAVVNITVNALPNLLLNPIIATVCAGASASLSVSGANTYTWNPGSLTGSVITPTPATGTNYTVVGTSTAGCTNTNVVTQSVTVNALPTVTASASSSVICNGGNTTLTATGADTYTWNPGNLPNGPISPPANTTYTVVGTKTLSGCTSTNLATVTINVNTTPTISIGVANSTICAGNAPTLTASNAATYTWNPGNYTTSVISPTLSATITFTLAGSSAAGCLSSNTITQTIVVNALPAVTASATSASVCAGFSTSLYGGGAATYTWSGGISNNTSFTPAASGPYTVTGTDANNCVNTATINITVNAIPSASANITSTAICLGSSLTLSGSGANTYSWTGGISDNTAFTPTASQNYTLTGYSSAGCSSTNAAVVSVTVNALPSLTTSLSNSVICVGTTVSVNAAGALTYTWSGGLSNNTVFTPSTSSGYTVTGTDANGCQNVASVSIVVNAQPVISIAGPSITLCEAQTVTLSATGAQSYSWSNSQSGVNIVVSPTITTSYTVTGTDVNSCISNAVFVASVAPCLGTLSAVPVVTNVSCSDKHDGVIAITTTNSYSNSVLSFIWSNATLCPTNDCDTLYNLFGGSYSLTVKVTYTVNNILVKQDSVMLSPIVVLNANGPCEVRIFSGVSPNGDGLNDTWQIDNIEEFPKNKVTLFNRWGIKVYETEGYDNAAKSWPQPGETAKLQSNTYFYIIDLGNGAPPLKGWVELIKN